MNRIFFNTLLISFLGHILIFFPWSGLDIRSDRKDFKDIEINYFQIKQAPQEEIKISNPIVATKSDKEEIGQSKVPEKKESPPAEKKEVSLGTKKEEKKQAPALTREEQMVARDFASLSKEPVFLDYYRAIREKIKISAHRHKPAFFNPGEVYIFFILDKQGELRRLKVIDSKSDPNTVLREAAMRSVEDASPFPLFPQGLNREQISFNIIIAFEIH
ncbi:MAG: TonB family protein [Candidatus Omnitrophica bacterium]|nr:TonB family protein [Candidatus Omnitrophota bacterium]